MNTNKRRLEILKKLTRSSKAITASALAEEFDVSRQIVVGDIAILRASGHEITATPRGYILESESSQYPYTAIIACKHGIDLLKEELYTVVDFGGSVIDVTIEHGIYGQIAGQLNLSSRHDVDMFVESVSGQSDKPLSSISGGIHLHKIGCQNEEIFNLIKNKLAELNILL